MTTPSARIDCVAFPDDGACKRFAKFFQKHLPGVEIVTCNKVRTPSYVHDKRLQRPRHL